LKKLLDRFRRLKQFKPRRVEMKVSAEVMSAASDRLLEMDEAIEEMIALPGLEQFAETRRLPENFFELWAKALAAYDAYVDTMSGGLPDAVRCTRGCTACCHDVPTGVQAVEYLALYRAYRGRPDYEDVHNRACDRGQTFFEELRAAGAVQGQRVQSDGRAYTQAQFAYRSRREPCVFLDESGDCSVYAWRPIPCRMHLSVTEPQWCWADDERADDAVTPNFAPPDAIVDNLRALAERLGLRELSPSLFQGLSTLGAEIMQHEPLQSELRQKRRKRFGKHGSG
jgi:Fe-S-cluster containining protein